MGQEPAVLADGEDVGGLLFAGKAAGHFPLEIEQERLGPAFTNGIGDAAPQEPWHGLHVGDSLDVGDILPALFQGIDPGVDFLGAAAIADQKEQRAGPGKPDGVLGAELVGELERLDARGFRAGCGP